MTEPLSWGQIKQRYPHQNVGLVDVDYIDDGYAFNSAVVKYTDNDTSYDELCSLAMEGKILLLYTTADEDDLVGVLG